jgi:dihydroorotase
VLLVGGRVIDPATDRDGPRDVRVLDGRIVASAPAGAPRETVVDCAGLVVAPAFVDPHVHFRDPGDGRSETTATGLAAALRGGYGTVFCMANTSPVNDDPRITGEILRAHSRSGSAVRLAVVTAATRGLLGREIVDLAAQKAAGAAAVSDDGRPVEEDDVMAEVLRRAAELGLPVFSHCETPSLHPGGVAHDGAPAREWGLVGIPSESEVRMVRRDIALAERLRVPVHLCHVSTAAAVTALREARARGVAVTAEAAPHHLVLDDTALRVPAPDGTADAHLKMNPPLRDPSDVDAVVEALADGTIDCVATDHAPHPAERKRGAGFRDAAFGVIGLENAFAVLHRHLVTTGRLSLTTLLQRMGAGGARVGRVAGGALRDGEPAGIVLLRVGEKTRIQGEEFRSLSRNCPFDGKAVDAGVAGSLLGCRLELFP